MTRTAQMLLVTLLAMLGLLVGVPAAQALPYTPNEVAYLTTLDQYAVPYSTPAAVLKAGYAVTAYLELTPTDAGVWTVIGTAVRAGFTPFQAGVIVGAAVRYLDPPLIPLLEQFLADNGYGLSQSGKVPVLR